MFLCSPLQGCRWTVSNSGAMHQINPLCRTYCSSWSLLFEWIDEELSHRGRMSQPTRDLLTQAATTSAGGLEAAALHTSDSSRLTFHLSRFTPS